MPSNFPLTTFSGARDNWTTVELNAVNYCVPRTLPSFCSEYWRYCNCMWTWTKIRLRSKRSLLEWHCKFFLRQIRVKRNVTRLLLFMVMKKEKIPKAYDSSAVSWSAGLFQLWIRNWETHWFIFPLSLIKANQSK